MTPQYCAFRQFDKGSFTGPSKDDKERSCLDQDSSLFNWFTTLGIFLTGIRRILLPVGDALLARAMQLKTANKIVEFNVVMMQQAMCLCFSILHVWYLLYSFIKNTCSANDISDSKGSFNDFCVILLSPTHLLHLSRRGHFSISPTA